MHDLLKCRYIFKIWVPVRVFMSMFFIGCLILGLTRFVYLGCFTSVFWFICFMSVLMSGVFGVSFGLYVLSVC